MIRLNLSTQFRISARQETKNVLKVNSWNIFINLIRKHTISLKRRQLKKKVNITLLKCRAIDKLETKQAY
jgi:hypothetical protein